MIYTINLISLNLVCIGLIWEQIRLRRKLSKAETLISVETQRKVAHTKVFDNLTDVDKIQEEMERGADIIEARQANRLLAPRPDAGPPARVFRPRLTGKRASYWNQRPN